MSASGSPSASEEADYRLVRILGLRNMPRYFIDTDDGLTEVADDEGHELADAMAARDLALRALSDMMRGTLSQSDRRAYTARVRAEDGSTIYGASLTLTGEWWIEPSSR